MMSFLHHPEDHLGKEEMLSLLQTLQDMEKTATWFQELVREVWIAMPQLTTVQHELQPFVRFCKLRLTTTSCRALWIELRLGIMALAFFFALLVQRVAFVGDELDAEMLECMRQREVFLQEQMTKILEEIERSRTDVQLWHFFARQPWEIWVLAVLLLFLLIDFIQCIDTQEEKGIQRETEMQRKSDGEMWEPVYHEGSNDVTYVSRFYYEFSIWPLKTRRHMCKMVEDLVDELLTICQILPQSYHMPQLQPAVGVGVGLEHTSPEGNHIVYRMLVPLKAPPGHVFHLEHGPKARVGVRNSCLRVELKCTCIRELVMRDMLCFVHHPEDKLRKEQMPSLLQTLCRDSYLDMEKTAAWFQKLVTKAWLEMPLLPTVQVKLLPSNRFCKLKLTTASSRVIWIELMLGIQDKDLDTFLSFE
ncbi:uncharacterized protein [Excalfactoria chinensis]|uniref:uncharacterized protein n=1 Tax=Excalfactoria chinensis TaxID=46218 RepID=UPI003B3A5778